MASLRLKLLGEFDLRLSSGTEIRLPTRKSRLLLAYLALTPSRAQPRAKLMGLLWSNRAEPQARGSLRQELHALRHSLAGIDVQPLRITDDAVAFDADVAAVDVILFERLIDRGELGALAQAAELYRGDLLEGVSTVDPIFDEWLSLERGRLRDLAIAGLGRLASLQIERGAFEAAAASARRLLALDPLHEETHRTLMRLLARQGRRNAALRQYQHCCSLLERELGVEPEEATQQLHRELLERPSLNEETGRLPGEAASSKRPDIDCTRPVEPAREGAETPTTDEMGTGSSQAPSSGPADTERRQLTVMFVDMVDSSALATQLDPEELHEVLGTYRNAVADAVVRFGGRVEHFLGDGVIAWFGWPQAHEDDAERTVLAGLSAIEAISRLRVPEVGALSCRVGIATGTVVVGDRAAGGGAAAIAGEVPYLATRLQAVAAPDTVVVSEPTRRLLGELFAFENLGFRPLKGFAAPVRVWRVAGESATASRFEALRGQMLTPLIGRQQELALLLERWEHAKEGEGQVVLLSGEPGIGKSRLVSVLCEELADESHMLWDLHCSPHHGNSALHPAAEALRRAAGLSHREPPQQQLDKLAAILALPADRIRDGALLLADLLAVPVAGREVLPGISPQRRKERTFQVLLGHLAGLAAQRPVLAVYEDVHWADPTTLELLDRVIDQVRQLPVLAVITFRPEFVPPWAGHGYVTAFSLGRLGRRQGLALIERMAGARMIPPDVRAQILARAEGVPLYLEELTRAVAAPEQPGQGEIRRMPTPVPPEVAVPATLKASLMAQLDRLDVVRQMTQVGAVIGREFSFELLALVAERPESDLRPGLERLIAAGLMHRSASSDREAYAFKHALVRDAAYESLISGRRRELHARIARTLEEAFPLAAAAEPEVLAHHLTKAGLDGQAIPYIRQAAERAAQGFANAEAIDYFRQALRLLAGLPAGPERDRTEVLLQAGLGVPLMASKGYSAPEVHQAYARASELCRQLDDAPGLFPVLFGLCAFHIVRPDLPAARPLTARLLAAARESGDDDLLLEACGVAGAVELYAGKLAAATSILERGFALYQPERHRDHAARYGQDPLAWLAFVARAHALAGRPDLARRRGETLVAATRDPAAQPNSLAALHAHLAQLHVVLRHGKVARGHAEAVIAVSQQQDLPLWTGLGRMYRGAALIEEARRGGDRSQVAEGIAEGLDGLAAYRSTGAGLDVATCLGWLATGHARLGQPREGLRLLDEALRVIADTGETYFASEAHRLFGELSLTLGPPDHATAETALSTALTIARQQGAGLFERRAAASLARLWLRQGRREQAGGLLAGTRESNVDGEGDDRAAAGTHP